MTELSTPCPRCGGLEVRRITPGFVECVTQVEVGLIPPGAHGNEHPLPVLGPCGHRFAVAEPGGVRPEPCWCGRDSIGACADCSRRLCGLHGTRTTPFLCGTCIRERDARAEAKARAEFEAQIAVVRRPGAVPDGIPAVRDGRPPKKARGRLEGDCPSGLVDLAQRLWADGERHGHRDLVGLAWTERFPSEGPDDGIDVHIVHHFIHVRRATRTVRKRFRGEREQTYIAAELDCWTAYAVFRATGRLCDIRCYKGDELPCAWGRMRSHASGDMFQQTRWVAVPPVTGRVPGHVTATTATSDRPLMEQLAADQAGLGLASWIDLSWTDRLGHVRRVADDAMVQISRGNGPAAYRALLVETSDAARSLVDREVLAHEEIAAYFDDPAVRPVDLRFTWPLSPAGTRYSNAELTTNAQ